VAETSFPVANGEGVTDATYERLMGPVMGSGRVAFNPVLSAMTTPAVYGDSSGRQVKAYANQAAVVRGFRWESGTTPPVVALDANTSGNPRNDLIVLRLDRSNFTVRLAKITGTPAAAPATPSPVQDESTTGFWDLPLARVRVTSSGTTGQPLIAAADVTDQSWWLQAPGVAARSGVVPNSVHGQLLTQTDTGRTYRGVGSAWTLLGEREPMTKLNPASGWNSDYIYGCRVNGMVYFQAQVSTNTNLASGTDVLVCTLPSIYRPEGVPFVSGVAWMGPNQIARIYINSSTGTVQALNYPQTFPANTVLSIHPMTWPASNL
jgi:hypothetical protein